MNTCKCEEIAEEGKSKVEKSLAMELLSEQVKNSRRWFSAFLIVLIMWFATIGGFIWFLNQYNFETYEQDGEGVNNINTCIAGGSENSRHGQIINGHMPAVSRLERRKTRFK